MTRRVLLPFFAAIATATTLPYNPSSIFVANNGTIAYVLDSTLASTGTSQLFSLDLTHGISNSTDWLRSATGLSLPVASHASYIIQDADGSLLAVSGDCQDGGSSTQISRLRASEGSSWVQADLARQQSIEYLSSGLAFSTRSDGTGNSSIYLFGGMCPSTGMSSWTANATYSSSMLKFCQNVTSGSKDDFTGSSLSTSGGPVAEAGLTITALPATLHSGVILQQQYVLIGGHTKAAFINMSQVAIFSVPQESWAFMPVQQPQGSRIDLAVRQATAEVEPRSGHTAVLSQDGTKIIVFGGWVGDITSPAQPQLAILEIGSGFGGDGQWQWAIPSTTGTGPATGSGVFGHGAALLPGNVMMVSGGYLIPAASGSSTRRADLTTQSSPLFFNISSNQWTSSYTLPIGIGSQGSPSPDSTGADTRDKIGLAVGLTVGLLILIAVIVFYFWYMRRLRRKRQEVERGLMSRSSDGSYTHIDQPFLEKTSIDGRGAEMSALNQFWMDPHGISSELRDLSAATGAFSNIPSPTRGLRKGSVSRNYQYHAAPRYDDKRSSRHSGNIHPIAELDNEDATSRISSEHRKEDLSEAQRQLKAVEAILNAKRTPERRGVVLNPLRSHPVSPELGETNGQAASARAMDTGRLSPTKTDDRTSSSLSERSHRSMLSDNSITRTMSTRTGALLAAAAAAAHVRGRAVEAEASTSSESRSNTMSTTGRVSPVSRRTIARSSTNGSSAGTESRYGGAAYAESFRTARSNATTAYDGDVMLSGPVALSRDDPYRRAWIASDSMPSRRRQGILGSLKKAIGAIAPMPARTGPGYGQLQSANTSPVKEGQNPMEVIAPRRAVSDGGALLRQKRGKHDWADSAWPPYRDDPDPGDWGEPDRTWSKDKHEAEEDWDVEDAAEKRDVQVMFTIPKSRLRVVNADLERASLRSVSDPLSRAGSVRVAGVETEKVLLPGGKTVSE